MKYRVSALVTISVWTDVEADSEEEAKEIAEERPLQGLCHQCSSARFGEGEREWRTSGELDGVPKELTAEEADG